MIVTFPRLPYFFQHNVSHIMLAKEAFPHIQYVPKSRVMIHMVPITLYLHFQLPNDARSVVFGLSYHSLYFKPLATTFKNKSVDLLTSICKYCYAD